MKTSDFDYVLPDKSIAIYPPKERGKTNLLVLNKKTGQIQHKKYSDLHEFLNPGDVLVLNNTKVLSARLKGEKTTGGKVELIVLEKHQDFSHKVMYRGHLKPDDEIFINNEILKVKNILGNGIAELYPNKNLLDLADKYGEVPLPPYMHREAEDSDKERYQTVFAKETGSIAAPTASLNFTKELENKLREKGVKIIYLTLHVGLGTFLPVRTENLEEHNMHSEFFTIPEITIKEIYKAKYEGRKIAAIGTTVTRTLEYNADKILNYSGSGSIEGDADIFIYPGYKFKIVDTLITNFHAPQSTVLMLASAFGGAENIKNSYQEALKHNYKFLSYGDSMLMI